MSRSEYTICTHGVHHGMLTQHICSTSTRVRRALSRDPTISALRTVSTRSNSCTLNEYYTNLSCPHSKYKFEGGVVTIIYIIGRLGSRRKHADPKHGRSVR